MRLAIFLGLCVVAGAIHPGIKIDGAHDLGWTLFLTFLFILDIMKEV